MKVLVYVRHGREDEALEHFREEYPASAVHVRNGNRHAEGQYEPCDLLLVDDGLPLVAEDYREGYVECEVRLFDANELGTAYATEPPEDAFREQFASATAYETAVDAGLSADDLEGLEPAGKTGYTTAQVRGLVGD